MPEVVEVEPLGGMLERLGLKPLRPERGQARKFGLAAAPREPHLIRKRLALDENAVPFPHGKERDHAALQERREDEGTGGKRRLTAEKVRRDGPVAARERIVGRAVGRDCDPFAALDGWSIEAVSTPRRSTAITWREASGATASSIALNLGA